LELLVTLTLGPLSAGYLLAAHLFNLLLVDSNHVSVTEEFLILEVFHALQLTFVVSVVTCQLFELSGSQFSTHHSSQQFALVEGALLFLLLRSLSTHFIIKGILNPVCYLVKGVKVLGFRCVVILKTGHFRLVQILVQGKARTLGLFLVQTVLISLVHINFLIFDKLRQGLLFSVVLGNFFIILNTAELMFFEPVTTVNFTGLISLI
jgi:hypothetical protein